MAYRFNAQKAKAAGYTDQQIQQMIQAGPPKEMLAQSQPQPQQTTQTAPEPSHQRGFLASLLPAGGSILGGIAGGATLGPVGAVGGATAGGAGGEWLAQLLSGEKSNIGEVGKQAGYGALGEVTGMGIGKLLGPVLGKGLKGGEEALQKSIVSPRVAASPFAASEEKALVKAGSSNGLRGSASNRYNKLEPNFGDLQTQIESKLAKKQTKISVADVLKNIDDNLPVNFDETNPTYVKAKDKFVNQILAQANKSGENGLHITEGDIYKSKQNLGKQLKKAFGKEVPSPVEETGLSIWGSLDNLMSKDVQALTRKESELYKLSGGLKASRDTPVRLPIIGNIPGARQPLQALQSGGADLLGALSKSGPVAQRVAGQGVGRSLLPSGGDTTSGVMSQPTSDLQSLQQSSETQPQSSEGGDMMSRLSNPDTLKQLALLDLMHGGKNIGTIAALSKFLTPPDTADVANKKAAIQPARTAIDNLSNSDLSLVGPHNRIAEIQMKLLGGAGVDQRVVKLNEQVELMKLNILRAYQGGRISDQDYALAERYIPNITDTPDTFKTKLSALKDVLAQIQGYTANSPVDIQGLLSGQ